MSDAEKRFQADPATSPNKKSSTQVGSVFVSNYPAYSFWNDEDVETVLDQLRQPAVSQQPLGLYMHIPFCRKRCKFCYFKVYTGKNSSEIQNYLDALVRELELYGNMPAIQNRPLRYIYFGGGTPSFISVKHLHFLVEHAKAALPWDQVEEVAFECEPGTLTESKLAAIREIGVTRLSLGVEHFNDDILRDNGRAHMSKEIYRVREWIKQEGFEQLNIDLIAGMVGDNWESWKETVQRAIDYDPDSVTIYQMELPHNAIYSQKLRDGESEVLSFADWDTKRAWQSYAIDQFVAAGYDVSSAYTVVKKSSKIKFVYRDALWKGSDMLAAGISSFGHFDGIHYQNSSRWNEYLGALDEGQLPVYRAKQTTNRDQLIREMILQLKLGRIEVDYFANKFDVNIVEAFGPQYNKLKETGMLNFSDRDVTLTREGLLQVDQLLPLFYDEQYQNARYT
ncbi:MAG: coproporphyrinogen-III oxidase family protein [Calditrichia bacterium]